MTRRRRGCLARWDDGASDMVLRVARSRLARPAPEAFDLTARIDDALCSGEERMTHGTRLGLQFGHGRTRLELIATEATDHSVSVIGGVKISFHSLSEFTAYHEVAASFFEGASATRARRDAGRRGAS